MSWVWKVIISEWLWMDWVESFWKGCGFLIFLFVCKLRDFWFGFMKMVVFEVLLFFVFVVCVVFVFGWCDWFCDFCVCLVVECVLERLCFLVRKLVRLLKLKEKFLRECESFFWFFNYKVFLLVLKLKMDLRWDNKEGKLKWWVLFFFNFLFIVLFFYFLFIFNYKFLIEI